MSGGVKSVGTFDSIGRKYSNELHVQPEYISHPEHDIAVYQQFHINNDPDLFQFQSAKFEFQYNEQ